jgi:hypothetical protein
MLAFSKTSIVVEGVDVEADLPPRGLDDWTIGSGTLLLRSDNCAVRSLQDGYIGLLSSRQPACLRAYWDFPQQPTMKLSLAVLTLFAN